MAKRSRKTRRPPEKAAIKELPTESDTARGPQTFSGKSLLQALVILAAGLWIYGPALHGDWLWDDKELVARNALVHDPAGLWKIWFEPGALIDYLPLKISVEWIEWHLWGNHTLGYHLVNVLLHVVGSLLIWRLFRQLGLRLAWLGGLISVTTSPLAGQEGEYLTSRKLDEVLTKACRTNVALEIEPTQTPEMFLLKGRGELQIVILLEELRRRGYELMVGRPEIIPHEKNGELFEAEDHMIIDVPDRFVGAVTETLSERGGKMESMTSLEASNRVRMEFSIPARGLIALRSTLLTKTKGEAIYSSSFKRLIPYLGKRLSRANGALVADRGGVTTEYGLFNLQDRGKLFVGAGVNVYEGMVFGENNRTNDLNANPAREKKLTNMRASGKDESTKLSGIYPFDLDSAIEWIDDDEWVEITPKTIRVRKDELRTNFRKVIRNVS